MLPTSRPGLFREATDSRERMTPHWYVDANMESPEVHEWSAGMLCAFSRRCPGHDHNEDSAAIFDCGDGRAVLAVADGAGGMPGGEQASKTAVKKLGTAIRKALENNGTLRSGVLDGFEAANKGVLELGIGAATTLSVVEIDKGELRTYHAGDSMTLVTGLRGKCKLLTVPHSPVGYAVEAGIINEKEAMTHEDRHIVSNLVGTNEMRLEVGPTLKLSDFDTLVLGSDGLFDNLHIDEVIDTVRRGDLKKSADELAKATYERMAKSEEEEDATGKPDDLSFVVFRRARKRRKRTAKKLAVPDISTAKEAPAKARANEGKKAPKEAS